MSRYTIYQAAPTEVRLEGKNREPWMLLPVSIISVPAMFVLLLTTPRMHSQDVLLIFSLLFLMCCVLYYGVHHMPVKNTIVFTKENIEWNRTFIVGKKEDVIDYGTVEKIEFDIRQVGRAWYKTAFIRVEQGYGVSMELVGTDCSMSAQQGHEAYAAVQALVSRLRPKLVLERTPRFMEDARRNALR